MIKKLQKKFIFIAAVSFLTVMVVVLGAINVANVYHMEERADGLITMLAENGGKFPNDKERKPEAQRAAESGQSGKTEPWAMGGEGTKPTGGGLHQGRGFQMSPETPFETRYFTVTADEQGTITAVDMSHIAALSDSEARQYAKNVLKGSRREGYTDTYRYAVIPMGEVVPAEQEGQLLIFVDCRNQIDTVMAFFWNSFGTALISLAVVLILLTILSRRAIRPIIESIEKQKQFITDAGHEIKTPLAIISANNDVIEMTAGPSEWTASTHNQVNRLNGLVKNLLTLAKMEEGQVDLVFSDLVISDVVKETAWSFIPLAEKRSINLEVEVQPGIVVKGDEASLCHLTAILVDNAIKYGKEGSDIQVTLEKRGKTCCLEVRNLCHSMPEGDLFRLFDRFYRADQSRSRESGGYGIGLSVAQAIVQAHDGQISARNEGGDVICFAVEL